jgi:exodeoxyribonuclease VII large subunit
VIAGRDWSRVPVVAVSRLANYVKRKLETDPKLAVLGVEGEVSNLRVQSSGSWNFDLKDRDAVLACFAFPSDAATFPEARNGDAVIVYGKVSTYVPKSQYQLGVRHLQLAGVGALYARYEALRRKLEAEGLFRADRKRPVPAHPFVVALVGSPSGNGTRDFETQARLRAPHVRVKLVPTPVQGDVAPQIVAALQKACVMSPDVVVLVRGGGSFEDLFVFNDERVVRAVANCPLPIVTAIGHESNLSLADYAASRYAPTPSTAAQTLLPNRDELMRELARERERMTRALGGRVQRLRSKLDYIEHRSPLAEPAMLLANPRQRLDAVAAALERGVAARLARSRTQLAGANLALVRLSPQALVMSWRQRFEALRSRLDIRFLAEKSGQLDGLAERLGPALERVLEGCRQRLALSDAQLTGADPHGPLRRGYAIVERAGGGLVVDPADAPPGTRLLVRLARGELAARVERPEPNGGEQIGLF